MRLRLHDLAAGEDGVAEFAAPLDEARGEGTPETGERLQLRDLIAKARLPRLAMHFLQSHNVRAEPLDHISDTSQMVNVGQLIVACDVVRHDDERPALRREAAPRRKADERAVLVAGLNAKARVNRPWITLAGTDGVDGKGAVEEDQEREGEDAEDQPSLRDHHGGAMFCTSRSIAARLRHRTAPLRSTC